MGDEAKHQELGGEQPVATAMPGESGGEEGVAGVEENQETEAEALQRELAETRDQLMRVAAEFDNFKKRMEREKIAQIRAGEDAFVCLARQTVESFVRGSAEPAVPDGLPEELTGRSAGVFVSLKLGGKLRGCIGTTAATQESIAEEIFCNAISACSEDPRFAPVSPDELDRIVYSVDVLGPTERIDSMEQLDVKRYGVIVVSGYRKGLLLPNLEGVDTIEEQIKIAKRKAGIPEDERCRMERFEVVRHT